MRLALVISLFLMLLPGLAYLNYREFSEDEHFIGPHSLTPSTSTSLNYIDFYFPSKALAEITCTSGSGEIYIADSLKKEPLVNFSFIGTLSAEFVVPHEGNYVVFYKGSGETQCLIRFKRPYPTRKVQDAYLIAGIFGSFLFAILWRGKR
ncbi:hypothetical protein [Thermococcus sp.]|uniref:hypothetical protein n=1 Tax=Thermococcus sp. TaxID=35749 RepID=UPI002618238B|nr:hypothetical protein [Thermococcus sp.]